MRKMNGKRFILGLMALMMCLTMCVPAFASTGDRVLMHETTLDGFLPMVVQAVVPCGDGFIIVKYSDMDVVVERYADAQAEPEVFVLDDETRMENGGIYVNPWFSWNGELYGFECKDSYTEESTTSKVLLWHVKLEDGKVILEDSGLPVDLSDVTAGEDGAQNLLDFSGLFTMDDSLIINVWVDEETYRLKRIDLNTGVCAETEIEGPVTEMVPGREGTVLITRSDWNPDTALNTVKVSSLNLKSGEIQEKTVIDGLENEYIHPCYDRNRDAMYIIKEGELWAVPQFDMEGAEAVNDCPRNGDGAILLPGGFEVIWEFDTVMLRNTDPSQRGSVVLRVSDRGDGMTMNETVYAMNNKRGDVSVIVQSDWRKEPDVVQAMLNRDSSTDIYSLRSDDSEFAALYTRGYLPDLSSNEKIVESTNRLYPYIRDMVMQDGKIIGVPVCFVGDAVGIHMEAWEELGGTAEELPKTWNQFFDWLETLPKKLEGKNVSLCDMWETKGYFRGGILKTMLDQYEIRMEKKGEKDYYFATPELCELVRRLDGLDYEALGIREDDEENMYEDEERTPLLQNGTSTLIQNGDAYVPLTLSFSEEEEPVLPVQVSVAFMNPYCEHPEEAMEFLALAADSMHGMEQYAAYTDKTEPIRSSDYEDEVRWYRSEIENLKERIEKAEDGEEREMLQEQLQIGEEGLEYTEKHSWMISGEQIERYQKWQEYFKTRMYSFVNILLNGDGEDDSSEYDRFFHESIGMNPEELLGTLDTKVRMIRMESN